MTASLRSIAQALGGVVAGRQVLAPGPGHSPRDRSLAVQPCDTAPDGFTVYSHAGDDFRRCRDHVKERLGLPLGRLPREITNEERTTYVEKRRAALREEEEARTRRISRATELWQAAVSPVGTVVEVYLASRGLALPVEVVGSVLRFHPSCPFGPDGRRERCMVAAMRDVHTDQLVGLHRTALTVDGAKIDRKMMGVATGAAIKLDPEEAVTHGLTIGEGVETVLAARQLGLAPAWAVGSVGAIAALPALYGVETLTLLQERDENGASERAVSTCAERWTAAGREVRVVLPRAGKDLNDALRGEAA